MKYKIESTDVVNSRNNVVEANWNPLSLTYDSPHIYTSHFAYGVNGLPVVGKDSVVVTHVIFDFDNYINRTDPDRSMAMKFIQTLESIYEVDPRAIGIYFSGKKGWHVVLSAVTITGSEYILANINTIKEFAMHLGKPFGIDQRMYEVRRLARCPNRVHLDTGLYKTRLSYSEFRDLPITNIKEIAKQPRVYQEDMEFSFSSQLNELFLTKQELVRQELAKPATVKGGDTLESFFLPAKEGERNESAAKLAGLLVSQGLTSLASLQQIMYLWNLRNLPPMDIKELRSLVTYSFNRYSKRFSSAKF